jgi:hypothetical protein
MDTNIHAYVGVTLGAGGANNPQYFSYLIIYFFGYCAEEKQTKIIGVRVGVNGFMCINSWFKPIFPLFLTRILHKVPNTHGRFCPFPPVF